MKHEHFWIYILIQISKCLCSEILGCGGFVKSDVEIQYSRVELKLYSKQGSLKYQTDCAPNNGYYFIPLYDKGDYNLKVEPPVGWSFEPTSLSLHVDGTSDACSQGQDINFQFTGFSVFGKVVSKGSDEGPAGVKVTLKKPNGEVIRETVTSQNGQYTFPEILPGDYKLTASHSIWKFQQDTLSFAISNDNAKVNNDLKVKGYDVTGQVRSDGEPIRGVNFLLFSKAIKSVEECTKSQVKGFVFSPGMKEKYLCYVTSGKDGQFIFPSLEVGDYQLVPFYKGEHIEFDVSPASLDFKVTHGSLLLRENFIVQGFSVRGQILMSERGAGIQDAKIFLNGKEQTTTYENGVYHFENMKTGQYSLEVVAQHMYFDPVHVRITPNTPQLQDIVASRYDVCGHFSTLSDSDFAVAQRTVKVFDSKREELKTLVSNDGGHFCTDLPKGTYTLIPEITADESNTGLQFSPPKVSVTIKDRPELSIVFAQFSAKVSGSIKCIEKCNNQLRLDPSRRNGEGFEIIDVNGGDFDISGLLPGSYQLTMLKSEWCWKKNQLSFVVIDKDISDLVFEHTGYVVSIASSHETDITVVAPKGEKFRFKIEPGTNSECLPLPGEYELVPSGCHVFKDYPFKFSTSSPSPVVLTAFKHLVSGFVQTSENATDVNINFSKQWDEGSEKETVVLSNPIKKDNHYVFSFSVLANTHSSLTIKPSSSKILFYPSVKTVNILDDCMEDVVTFVGKLGLFIRGMITPPLAGVTVKVFVKGNSKDEVATVQSDQLGKYVIGPLDEDATYEVTAEKEGYNLENLKELGHFQAFKLAEVIVKVENDKKEALSGVLVTLSGGVDYRKNSVTQEGGQLQFMGLGPGQYFLRPIMKEYQFDPPSKMITVSEGTTMNVTISGSRVAFSCLGVVNSLTGEAEPGLVLEAKGIGSAHCQQFQEETTSEQDGMFRLRDLQPNCQYSVHLKAGAEENQHIERVSPSQRIIQVINGDVQNIRLIVFRHFSQMDISGYVATSQEFLSTLKVRLFREDSPDQAVHTHSLGQSSFFHLPILPVDGRSYILRLDTSLSSSAYHWSLPSTSFKANTTYLHFNFHFKPQPRLADQEMVQGSTMVLPLLVVISILVFNYNKVLPLLGVAGDLLQSIANPARVGGTSSIDQSNPESLNRRRVKPKKI